MAYEIKVLILFQLVILLFTKCQTSDICSSIFLEAIDKSDSEECLELSSWYSRSWDTLYIISSNMYPDEIEELTGVEYPYAMHHDPNKVLLFTENRRVVSRQCGRCLNLFFSNTARVKGIITISKEKSCVKSKKNPDGHLYLTVE